MPCCVLCDPDYEWTNSLLEPNINCFPALDLDFTSEVQNFDLDNELSRIDSPLECRQDIKQEVFGHSMVRIKQNFSVKQKPSEPEVAAVPEAEVSPQMITIKRVGKIKDWSQFLQNHTKKPMDAPPKASFKRPLKTPPKKSRGRPKHDPEVREANRQKQAQKASQKYRDNKKAYTYAIDKEVEELELKNGDLNEELEILVVKYELMSGYLSQLFSPKDKSISQKKKKEILRKSLNESRKVVEKCINE